MSFNSIHFLIFLPIVFLAYWTIPAKWQWIILLVSSYYFYMSWNVKYIVLILVTTVISYGSAIQIELCMSREKKKLFLNAAVIANAGILFLFKYFNFTLELLDRLCEFISIPMHSVTLSFLLPVGISFYIFQSIGYLIDVYRGDISAERHFGKYALFVSFFPQLVAGPIERSSNLLRQMKSEHIFNYSECVLGLRQILIGFFKKVVIADTLSIYVDQVFDNPNEYYGFSVLLASIFFTFQIYCDFSGYSDIAIGTAKMFGVKLMQNFHCPYLSRSVREFWSRWHISLSTWFRDYLYIPLGGNRKGKLRKNINALITFLVSGLWHGANVTFVLWGGVPRRPAGD